MDGANNKRCYSVITPTGATEEKPVPVMFWFHPTGGDASLCGQIKSPDDGKTLAELAGQNGFALVCGEANQYPQPTGGEWNIPVVMNDTTGNQCNSTDTGAIEITYL